MPASGRWGGDAAAGGADHRRPLEDWRQGGTTGARGACRERISAGGSGGGDAPASGAAACLRVGAGGVMPPTVAPTGAVHLELLRQGGTTGARGAGRERISAGGSGGGDARASGAANCRRVGAGGVTPPPVAPTATVSSGVGARWAS